MADSAREVLARLAAHAPSGLISVEDAARTLGKPRSAASRELTALVGRGWLSRVRRGLYSIRPIDAAPGVDTAVEDPWSVAMRTFAPCYVGGWSAAGHWGLTEQLYRVTMVITERRLRSTRVNAGGSDFLVAREIRPAQTGLVTIWRANARIRVSGIERTLMDACAHPLWVGGGSQLVAIFIAAVADARFSPVGMLREARDASSGAALGRLGFLAERYWPEGKDVAAFALANRGTGYSRMDPSIKRNGRLTRRWGIWMNIRLPEATNDS